VTSRTFSAPGKLVLCGEYAVVDGRAAVVAAVDRRATAVVDDAADLRVRGNDPRWLPITDAILDETSDGARDQPLLVAVLRELRARGLALPPVHVAVSTTAFSAVAGGAKLGLGSSAAAAVAFTSVFAMQLGVHEVHEIARAAHRAFQGGGSGIDVAASAYGGLLRFQQGKVTPAPPLPRGLDVVVAFTGIAAKTQGFVDAWRALPDRAIHVDAISSATGAFLTGCANDDAGAVVGAVESARVAMEAMGRDARIDVVTAEHRRIAQLAARAGGASKPSGAGGGDVAVCFVPSDARAALEEALAAERFLVVGVNVGAPGARLDP
jgi:phosphomevalonate kinase